MYHIETSNSSREMTDDLKKSSETQQNNEQSSNQQTQSKDITDESEIDHGKSGNQRMESLDFPAIEIIRKRANELATEVFKMKFTFKDCNFVSFSTFLSFMEFLMYNLHLFGNIEQFFDSNGELM